MPAMQLVFTHPNLVVVEQMRSLLQREGIDCTLRNEYASGASGELAPFDTWPELWLLDDADYDRANRVMEAFQGRAEGPEWRCAGCGRSSPETFEMCWHCGAARA
jgi:hypothetical protein